MSDIRFRMAKRMMPSKLLNAIGMYEIDIREEYFYL